MQRDQWMIEVAGQLGHLTASVSEGFRGVHQRISDQDRSAMEWRRHFSSEIRRIDKRRPNGNGHGKIPYGKIACLMGLLIIGAMGHIWPGAMKKASVELLERVLIGQVRGGG